MGTRISFFKISKLSERPVLRDSATINHPTFLMTPSLTSSFYIFHFVHLQVTNLLFISRKMFSNKPFFISKLYTAHSQICLSREPLEKGSRFFFKKNTNSTFFKRIHQKRPCSVLEHR